MEKIISRFRNAAISLVGMFGLVSPSWAIDLFESGKTTVTDTIGTGSSGEFYILAAGLIGGIIGGIVQKNWVGGIIGFFVGVVFWEVGKAFVGL
ncbi:hypothetical protein [Enterovibrio norvegicus]|uniref:Pilin n=1 Tax=Enterovibrio norvegicus TaxID=188144 RepID=A0ABV4L532_9GAMM